MNKRPSLAETMRQAVQVQPELSADADLKKSRSAPAHKTNSRDRFHAVTREGKKKVTGNLSPSMHKLLKTLAVQQETTTEALLAEAIGDLLAKYNIRDKAA
jgi:hypothetical protein